MCCVSTWAYRNTCVSLQGSARINLAKRAVFHEFESKTNAINRRIRMATQDQNTLDLRSLFNKIKDNLTDLLEAANQQEEDQEAATLILKRAATIAQNLVEKFVELEDRMAVLKPNPSAADVEAEIK